MKLSELYMGKGYRISKLGMNSAASRRLVQMGCREGMEVEVVASIYPLTELRIGETLVALKICECGDILVEQGISIDKRNKLNAECKMKR